MFSSSIHHKSVEPISQVITRYCTAPTTPSLSPLHLSNNKSSTKAKQGLQLGGKKTYEAWNEIGDMGVNRKHWSRRCVKMIDMSQVWTRCLPIYRAYRVQEEGGRTWWAQELESKNTGSAGWKGMGSTRCYSTPPVGRRTYFLLALVVATCRGIGKKTFLIINPLLITQVK